MRESVRAPGYDRAERRRVEVRNTFIPQAIQVEGREGRKT